MVAWLRTLSAGDNDGLQEWLVSQDGLELFQKAAAHHQHSRAAVAEKKVVLLRVEQCVHRDGDRTDFDRAPENGGKVDGVGHAEQNALFHLDAELSQRI